MDYMSSIWIYHNESCSSGRPAGKSLNVPIFFVCAVLMGTIDFYHFNVTALGHG